MMGYHMHRRTALQLALLSPRLAAARPAETDSYGDGWPDSLRLRDRADQEAFRAWSVWLAESLWASQPALPAEINDCAALLRFCAREALREHTAEWGRRLGLAELPPLGEIQQYHYPLRGWGGAFFRVKPGPLREGDVRNGAFREFADAEHLMRFNCHSLGRRIAFSRPGDLFFYRQLDDFQPFHSMIVAQKHAIYHTGPASRTKGEMRRLQFDELLRHPEPRWRPVGGNGNFLGVFRWNLLRDPS